MGIKNVCVVCKQDEEQMIWNVREVIDIEEKQKGS